MLRSNLKIVSLLFVGFAAFVAFGPFAVPVYALGISSGFHGGTSYSSLADDDYTSGDLNPAGFAFIKGYGGGAYGSSASSSIYPLPAGQPQALGLFGTAAYQNFSFYGAAQALSGTEYSDIKGAGGELGLGYNLNHDWKFGGYVGATSESLSLSAGVIRRYRLGATIYKAFGIQRIHFGLAIGTNEQPYVTGKAAREPLLLPSLGIYFIDHQYVDLNYFNTIWTYGLFRDISISNAIRLGVMRLFHLEWGFRSHDYFTADQNYLGAGLSYKFGDYKASLQANHFLRAGNFHSLTRETTFGIRLDSSIKIQADSEYGDTTSLVHYYSPKGTFTPNGDSNGDVLELHLFHESLKEVADWNVIIKDDDGLIQTVLRPQVFERKQNGFFDFPAKVVWAGQKYTDEIVKDGKYELDLLILTKDGRKLKWDLESIACDSKLPEFNMLIKTRNLILEDSDNSLHLEFKDKAKDIVRYDVQVRDKYDKVHYEQSISVQQAITIFSWNGIYPSGARIGVGNYLVEVTGLDRGGNKVRKVIDNVYVYPPNINYFVELQYESFSPNGDGRRDRLPISFRWLQEHKIKKWQLSIRSFSKRKLVRIYKGDQYLPRKIAWEGKDDAGKVVGTGLYILQLEVFDNKDRRYSSLAYQAMLDNEAPKLRIEPKLQEFTPDNDGLDDTVTIDIYSQDVSQILAYKIFIKDRRNNTLLEVANRGKIPPVYTWNGKVQGGVKVQALDEYLVELEAMDAAGNVARAKGKAVKTGIIFSSQSSQADLGKPSSVIRFPNLTFPPGAASPYKEDMIILERLARYLNRHRKLSIQVDGHTDSVGNEDYNQKLSQKRAEFVRKFLVDKGVNAESIVATGYGESKPLYEEKNAYMQRLNRRIEFTFK